jgi:hypothetical protein
MENKMVSDRRSRKMRKRESERERERRKNDMTRDCVMYNKQKQSEWKELDTYRGKRGG